jgi:hypothetical protein
MSNEQMHLVKCAIFDPPRPTGPAPLHLAYTHEITLFAFIDVGQNYTS